MEKFQGWMIIDSTCLFFVYSESKKKRKLASLNARDIQHCILHAHRGEILYSRGRISSCKTVYIEFL